MQLRAICLIVVLAGLCGGVSLRAEEGEPFRAEGGEPCCPPGNGSGGQPGYDPWVPAQPATAIYHPHIYRVRGWLPGPDGCPRQMLLYDTPRLPWYVVADAVALKRDVEHEVAIASIGGPDDIVFTTNDLKFEFQTAFRGMVGHQINDWYAIEGTYLSMISWDETNALRNQATNALGTAGNLFSPFSGFGDPALAGVDFNSLVSIRVASSMEGAELNVRQRVKTPPSPMQATALYGFRYFKLDERFEYRTESAEPAPAGTLNFAGVDADNELFGFQLGGMIEYRLTERIWSNFEAKAAICHNEASQLTSFDTGPVAGPATNITAGVDEDRTAFLGDFSYNFMFQFAPRLVGRIGYQAILIDGVAIASENFQTNLGLLTLGPPLLDHDGTIFFHGPSAGLMYTW